MTLTFWRRIQFLFRRQSELLDLEAEMRLHRELRARQIANADGIPAEAAAQQAGRRFGNEAVLKETANDMWGWTWMEDSARDLRQTTRMLAANPAFTIVAILTLALGIGANTAIFTVTNTLLMRQMPVAHPEQLFRVFTTGMPAQTSNTGDSQTSFSAAVFQTLRKEHSVLSELVAYVPLGFNKISVRAGSVPEEASADQVSGNFFSGLGVQAACGRLLSNQDESTHAPVAIVSYGYAARQFGTPCAAIGRPIFVRGVALTVAGVAAPSFFGVEAQPTDVWIPFQVRPELNAWGATGTNFTVEPKWWCILMMARIRDGVTQTAAEAALNLPFRRASYEPLGGRPIAGERPVQLSLKPARGIAGSDGAQQPLMILQIMVGLLLVIACANVSMLMAVRNSSRSREFSVRLALGGGKGRLIRQLLTESLVLVVGGTLLGLLMAIAASRVLGRWADLEVPLTPDGTVLWFTIAISAVVAVAFGIGPAFYAWRVPLTESLKNSAATAHRDRSKVSAGRVLTSLQLALCLVLLAGTGLLVQTLQNLSQIKIGFPTGGLLVFGVTPSVEGKDDSKILAFYNALLQRLRSVPGVQSVTLTGNRIASHWSNNTDAILDGQQPKNSGDIMLRWNNVGPDFFTTMGIRMIAGRDFNSGDSAQSAPVAVVNRTFVKRFLGGRNALGHTASFTSRKAYTIVGVAEDSKYTSLDEQPLPMAWFPYTQTGDPGGMHVEVRTPGPVAGILPALRRTMAEFAPDLAMLQPRSQQAEFDATISTQTLLAKLAVGFAILATILVTIGLYGTISYGVKQRTAEVGIRMALGAERASVVWMVLRDGLILCGLGLLIGIPLMLTAGHFLASLLYGVKPTDPVAMMLAGLLIVLATGLASYFPARRAAGINPTQALRHE